MKAIAVAAIFSCLFIASSAQSIECTLQGSGLSTAEQNCLQRFVTSSDASNFCKDCRSTLLNYINRATCTDESDGAVRQGT